MAKGRILAIDNDGASRTLYQELLGNDGYYVRTAAGVRDAMEALRREEFDLVVTELHAGVGNEDITESIRRHNPAQEIVVVTDKNDASAAVEAMKRGVSDYLLKPVNPDEFLLLVGKILFRQALRVEHKKLLDENIEFHQTLGYYQKCLAFLRIHDLDRLGDQIIDTLMELLQAEGGLLWLPGFDGRHYRLRCRRGLVKVAADEETLTPDETLRALLFTGEPVTAGQGANLWLPLAVGSEGTALIRIEAPVAREAFTRRDLKIAALVGEFAAGALHNVLLVRDLEQNTLRVPRGQAYNMTFFQDHIDKELHKSRRYGRGLSLIRLSIDNHRQLAAHFRGHELDEAMRRIIEAINSVLRDADILAMAAFDEYYMLLPETDYWGSLVAQKRIRKALKGMLSVCDLKKSLPIALYLRSAAYPADGATFQELRAVAGLRLERLKKSLFHRPGIAETPFWPLVERLLGTPGDYSVATETGGISGPLSVKEDDLRCRYFRMPAVRLDEIIRAFCREVVESSRVRGIIYRGCDDFDKVRQSLRHVEALEKSATSIFLLGGRTRAHWDYQRLVPLYMDDDAFGKIPFILYLNEDCAYALFARRRGEELLGFHTSDFYFVENMIAKLQEQYQLQAQI
ncbi:response regulator [Trichloromonas sp.]|uniref:response regulator n=1 Tax=Trichloromonas sp. TaxID=3069249 RepID=UPI002A3EA7A2|nr:response regulator [Trichloromonas sp.]